MSREVIDESPAVADWAASAPPGPSAWVGQDVVPADLTDPDGPSDLQTWGPAAPDAEPGGSGRGPGDGPGGGSGRGSGRGSDRGAGRGLGGWTRRTLDVPWTTGLVVAALVLGALAGGVRAQRGAEVTAQAGTRLLVWVDDLSQQRNETAPQVPTADFMAVARSTGGAILVHQLTTPFGSVSFGPDIPVDDRSGHALHVALAPDCSSFPQWGDDWTKAPRTGTAMVRDQLGAPLHEVPVDLVGDLLLAELAGTCRLLYPDPAPATSSSQIAGTTGLIFTAVSGSSDGTLTIRVLDPSSTGPHALLDLTVLDQLSGQGRGQFTLSSRQPLPLTLNPGDDVHLTVTLTYRCLEGGAQLPVSADSVLVMRAADVGTGELVDAQGWSQADTADAVRGAQARAGCPATTG